VSNILDKETPLFIEEDLKMLHKPWYVMVKFFEVTDSFTPIELLLEIVF
jgi:hypothetical protein